MIAEAGLIALWLAFALALLQLALVGFGLAGGKQELLGSVRPIAVAQGGLITVAFALLITLFLRSDMSVLLVVNNSHSMKPWLYKFAGTWGNHEGSMLLWVTVMPSVRSIHAPSTHGRMARANAASTRRVSNAPIAKENATDSPT